MLSLLHIENIAVIECADISFDQGCKVLTGETGAGKSIVIDAISAILGERAYRDMIRTGTNKASVRAIFSEVPQLSWFAENGVVYDPESVIQREVHLDGKNICPLNDRNILDMQKTQHGTFLLLSGQQTLDLAAERRGGIVITHDDEYGIIACNGS